MYTGGYMFKPELVERKGMACKSKAKCLLFEKYNLKNSGFTFLDEEGSSGKIT
jgi:hypothetical protein